MGGHRSRPYDAGVYFYAVQAVKFMGGYEPRPYEATVCFYAVQVVRFMGGCEPRPYEATVCFYVVQTERFHKRLRASSVRSRGHTVSCPNNGRLAFIQNGCYNRSALQYLPMEC